MKIIHFYKENWNFNEKVLTGLDEKTHFKTSLRPKKASKIKAFKGINI